MFNMMIANLALSLLLVVTAHAKQHGFLRDNGNGTWIIGNDVWNMTQEKTYGSKLYYKGTELVGEAAGHYVSYSTSSLSPKFHMISLTDRNRRSSQQPQLDRCEDCQDR